MALLDVSEVLADPDFADPLVCVRNTQSVDGDGIAQNTPSSFRFTGVVTNDGGDVLDRAAAGTRLSGRIVVHTSFRLQAGSSTLTADIVTWNGRRYTVATLDDYSHFGRGFVAARCDLIPLSG